MATAIARRYFNHLRNRSAGVSRAEWYALDIQTDTEEERERESEQEEGKVQDG